MLGKQKTIIIAYHIKGEIIDVGKTYFRIYANSSNNSKFTVRTIIKLLFKKLDLRFYNIT